MALWQFELNAIPATAANRDGIAAIHLSQEHLDSIELRFPANLQTALFSFLSDLLPQRASWSPALHIWGDENTDDIRVWMDGDRVESVEIRLDMRNPSLGLIGGICILGRQFDWVFASKMGAIIVPSREAVARAAMLSEASKFVRDPRGFIEAAMRADGESD